MFICSTVRNSELKFFSVIRRSADAERKQIVSYLQSNLSYRPLKVEVGNGETVPLCTSALDGSIQLTNPAPASMENE
jgi:hypothetical protein